MADVPHSAIVTVHEPVIVYQIGVCSISVVVGLCSKMWKIKRPGHGVFRNQMLGGELSHLWLHGLHLAYYGAYILGG